MSYLDKSGLSRLWSKIKSYVTNHHMDMSPPQTHPMNPHNAGVNLQFGDTFLGSDYAVIGGVDSYGHITSKIQAPTFTLPTVECGVLDNAAGATSITFKKIKNTPKLIKLYLTSTSSDFGHSRELCAVWCDGENVVSHGGAIQSATNTGFTFSGYPGEHYWEAWG